jgi:uncharacterized protein
MTQLTPVSVTERIESLDVLRGVALLGILAMNIRAMAGPFGSYMYPYALFEFEGANRLAFLFTAVFFDLKMMGLFSMLFGAGVVLYAAKADRAGTRATGLWFRRMGWLLAIGLVHAYLIWNGDILVPYAMSGLLLLWWVRRWSARALVIAGLCTLLIGGALSLGQLYSWDSMGEAEKAEQLTFMMPTPEQAQAQVDEMRGSYPEIVAARAPVVLLFQTLIYVTFFLWRTGGMMLLGMGLFKAGFLDGRRSAASYRRTAAACLLVGVSMSTTGVLSLEAVRFSMPERTLPDLWNYIGSIFSSVGYAAGILAIVKAGALAALRKRLAAVGQMAFSNYLGQSIITAILFLGWGFDLVGRFNYATQLLIVAAVWVLQLIVSPLWLALYRFGPAEWLWRSLTYWQRQPMARS